MSHLGGLQMVSASSFASQKNHSPCFAFMGGEVHIYFSLVPQQTRKISASPQGCWGGPFTSYGSVLLRDVLSALLHRPFSHRKTLAAAWFPTGWGCQENPEMGGGGGIKKNKQKAYGNRGGKPTTAAVVIQEEKAQACGCKARRTQQPCDGTLSSCCCIAPASITPATEPTPIAPCNTKKGEKKKDFSLQSAAGESSRVTPRRSLLQQQLQS